MRTNYDDGDSDSFVAYSAREVARFANVSVHLVHTKAKAGTMPPFFVKDGSRYWRQEHIIAAIIAARKPSLDDAA